MEIKEKKPRKKVVKEEFHVSISLNDQVFEMDTEDLREAILSVAPQFLRTKVILKITKDGKTLERFFYLKQGKMLFYNKYSMDNLINKLIF